MVTREDTATIGLQRIIDSDSPAEAEGKKAYVNLQPEMQLQRSVPINVIMSELVHYMDNKYLHEACSPFSEIFRCFFSLMRVSVIRGTRFLIFAAAFLVVSSHMLSSPQLLVENHYQ